MYCDLCSVSVYLYLCYLGLVEVATATEKSPQLIASPMARGVSAKPEPSQIASPLAKGNGDPLVFHEVQ